MRTRLILTVLILALALGAAATLSAADKPDPEAVAKLIQQLGSGEAAERDKAAKELEKLGAAAVEELKTAAAKADDKDLKARLDALVKKLEAQAAADKVLKPTKVHLVCKDTPVKEAVADLAKKSGFPINLLDPQNTLADRKVTLDTGEVTFWEALDQLCQKASLVEMGTQMMLGPPGLRPLPPPLPPGKDPPPGTLPVLPPAQGARPVIFNAGPEDQPKAPPTPAPLQAPGGLAGGGPGVGLMPGFPMTITLTDGKGKELPTHYAGALRIRAMPGGIPPVPALPRTEGEVVVTLQVSAEPKLMLRRVSAQATKAVDDQGQELAAAAKPVEADGNAGPPRLVPPGMMMMMMGGQVAHVRLKAGEKASKSLKELSGTLTAQVLTKEEPLLSVENVLKAAGQAVKGEGGGSLQVTEIAKGDNGSYKLKVVLEAPPDTMPPAPTPPRLGPPGVPALPPGTAPPPLPPPAAGPPGLAGPGTPVGGLSLLDDKGQAVPMQVVGTPERKGDDKKATWGVTFSATPKKDQGEPAKLVYSGSRVVSVDVPFTLKDVPLP